MSRRPAERAVPQPPDPQRFETLLQLVGRLNYTWTNTESLLIHLIAGLAPVDKETATVVFLTLNTARSRLDLVERLAKMDRRETAERDAVLALTERMARLSGLRNRYNHCIYSFDADSGSPQTILMRIADRKDRIMMGQRTTITDAALEEIRRATATLEGLNRDIWSLAVARGYPV